MNALIEALNDREKTLDFVIGKINRSRKKTPEGKIRICSRKGRTQYYLLNDHDNRVGTYIRQKDVGIVYAIAQKEYNQKVLESALREKQRIIKFRKGIQSNQIEDLYFKMCKDRQALVTPVRLSDEDYVKKWMSVQYEGKGFNSTSLEYYSEKGERMRSKSEVIIANLLNKYNVPYLYEFPVEIADIGIVYPDFRILNVRKRKVILWEHFGMMDDREYRDSKIVEVEKYHMSGFYLGDNLIFTMETLKKSLNVAYVEMLIRHYCI